MAAATVAPCSPVPPHPAHTSIAQAHDRRRGMARGYGGDKETMAKAGNTDNGHNLAMASPGRAPGTSRCALCSYVSVRRYSSGFGGAAGLTWAAPPAPSAVLALHCMFCMHWCFAFESTNACMPRVRMPAFCVQHARHVCTYF